MTEENKTVQLKYEELEKVSGGDSDQPESKYKKGQTVYYWWENGSFLQIYGVIQSAIYDPINKYWKYLIHHDTVNYTNGLVTKTIEPEDEYIYEEYIIR